MTENGTQKWRLGIGVVILGAFAVLIWQYIQPKGLGSDFAITSTGIFMGTKMRSMPQFGLLLMLIILPLQMLSGGFTPRENMPEIVQTIMLAAPVMLAQSVLFRGQVGIRYGHNLLHLQ